MSAPALAHIAELWRYPVKSMRGEQVDSLGLLADGIEHDRRFAIESSGAPRGKPMLTGRERAAMLLYTASVRHGRVHVQTPAAGSFALEDPALLAAIESTLDQGHTLRLVRSQVPLTDCRPIAMLSHKTIAQLAAELGRSIDARRFRANIVLTFTGKTAGFPEDRLVGQTLRLGPTAALRITERDPRCRIVTLDPETAASDPALMKHLDRQHQGRLGIYAATVTPGTLHVGDPVVLA